jgi:hypothetical protein
MNQGTTARLKVNVRIGTDFRSARITVLGLVTTVNLPALSVIARRTSSLLPGKQIILDLSHARAAAAVLEKLHDPGHLMKLAAEKQGQHPSCTFRVLAPTEATATAQEGIPFSLAVTTKSLHVVFPC